MLKIIEKASKMTFNLTKADAMQHLIEYKPVMSEDGVIFSRREVGKEQFIFAYKEHPKLIQFIPKDSFVLPDGRYKKVINTTITVRRIQYHTKYRAEAFTNG